MPTRGGDWYDGGFWQRLYLHRWEPFEGPFKATWNYLYQVITLANQAIIDLDGHPDLQAEARGLRALYYYELLDLFGNVPLVTAPVALSVIVALPEDTVTVLFFPAFLSSNANAPPLRLSLLNMVPLFTTSVPPVTSVVPS